MDNYGHRWCIHQHHRRIYRCQCNHRCTHTYRRHDHCDMLQRRHNHDWHLNIHRHHYRWHRFRWTLQDNCSSSSLECCGIFQRQCHIHRCHQNIRQHHRKRYRHQCSHWYSRIHSFLRYLYRFHTQCDIWISHHAFAHGCPDGPGTIVWKFFSRYEQPCLHSLISRQTKPSPS